MTQADINHGSIVDHATTEGTTPSGGTSTIATSNTVTVNVTQTDTLSIAKSANPTDRDCGWPAGDIHVQRDSIPAT